MRSVEPGISIHTTRDIDRLCYFKQNNTRACRHFHQCQQQREPVWEAKHSKLMVICSLIVRKPHTVVACGLEMEWIPIKS
jgi:hypothetical protein